jgi:hypothetical protein
LPDRLPSLSEMGVTQLYPAEPNQDRTIELRNLTKSALLNYLELVGIMSVDPSAWTEKLDDLRIIFINLHHLLNEYRPHQVLPSRDVPDIGSRDVVHDDGGRDRTDEGGNSSNRRCMREGRTGFGESHSGQ